MYSTSSLVVFQGTLIARLGTVVAELGSISSAAERLSSVAARSASAFSLGSTISPSGAARGGLLNRLGAFRHLVILKVGEAPSLTVSR